MTPLFSTKRTIERANDPSRTDRGGASVPLAARQGASGGPGEARAGPEQGEAKLDEKGD